MCERVGANHLLPTQVPHERSPYYYYTRLTSNTLQSNAQYLAILERLRKDPEIRSNMGKSKLNNRALPAVLDEVARKEQYKAA
jgi:hypothetical protein